MNAGARQADVDAGDDAGSVSTEGLALPDEALGLLQAFVADDSASAAAMALVRPDGEIGLATIGRTRRWRAAADGALLPDLGQPIGPDSRFDLASLTKPIATLGMVLDLLATERLTLNTTLGALLADTTDRPIGEVTVAQLLGHASGWPAWRDFAAETGLQAPAALRAAVLATAQTSAPGTAAVYSDLGYMTLGWIVEALCASPLDQAFAAHRARWSADAAATASGELGYLRRSERAATADPLHAASEALSGQGASQQNAGIVATEIWPGRSVAGRALCAEVHDDNAAGLDGVAGHAGLFGSVRAVAAWATPWLEATRDGGTSKLAGRNSSFGGIPEGVAPWMRQLVATSAAPSTTWRLGWDTPSRPVSTAGSRASARAFGHLGFVGTSVWIDPSREAAIVLLTNRVHPTRSRVDAIRALRPALHDVVWDALDASRRPPRA